MTKEKQLLIDRRVFSGFAERIVLDAARGQFGATFARQAAHYRELAGGDCPETWAKPLREAADILEAHSVRMGDEAAAAEALAYVKSEEKKAEDQAKAQAAAAKVRPVVAQVVARPKSKSELLREYNALPPERRSAFRELHRQALGLSKK
jgi:hypothetical protein